MDNITIHIINQSDNALPCYATEGSSGMDIRAFCNDDITLLPLDRYLVPTGLYVELPAGYEAQVRPRSGLAIKQGLTCLNSPGTIDADYRGEIKVILINLSNSAQVIRSGDRIAQLVFQKVAKATLQVAVALQESSRGEGGFGHTGKL